MKVIAVVVTYNRKELVIECIRGILSQTIIPDEIIVVDNNSTDGTEEYLIENDLLDHIRFLRLERNEGCSGGVYYGIKEAYARKAEWVWVMDDDTKPTQSALEKLINTVDSFGDDLSYVCSKVIWKDGSTHKVNVPTIKKYNDIKEKYYFDFWPYLLVDSCSFVSVLISSKSIVRYGLPIKEFFIWQDDIEYSKRLISGGEYGLLNICSIVYHQTKYNYSPNPYELDVTAIDKYKHECRNKVFVSREFNRTSKHLLMIIKYLFIDSIRIAINRRDHRFKFAMANVAWTIKGFFFRPPIRFVK